LSQKEIEESLNLLQRNWTIDPILREFILGKITDVTDYIIKVKDVIFHIPYDRQGRLPLTSDDLIIIGKGLKYQKASDFIKNETITTTWKDVAPSGQITTLTTINLKRKTDETEQDDGTHISCRFLDNNGGCSMHPDRPGVCYLYPFSTWLENEKGLARVHATYQFTGDCPGFYLSEDLHLMKQELTDYSKIIYDYNMSSSRTMRENFGFVSFG